MQRFSVLLAIAMWAVPALGGDKPRFNSAGELLFPENYREWVFLSSGLGMTYGPNRANPQEAPRFTNVFVNPEAHKAFRATGRWPEGTMFVLEIRRSSGEGSINRGGSFQSRIAAIEVEVKDARRFESGWAFFDFAGGEQPRKPTAAAFGPQASCQPCHSTNGAVENTFVQFYPTLLPIAKQKGTLKPGFESMLREAAPH